MADLADIDFDHHSPELVGRLEETYADLRERCPVAHTAAHGGYWVMSSYDAVYEVAHEHEAFASDNDVDNERNGYGGNTIPPGPVRFGFVQSDAPYWTAIRRLMNPFFAPPAVERWRPIIRDITTACIDRVIEQGRADVVHDIASPIPAILTLRLLDLPLDRWTLYADAMHHLNTSAPGTPAGDQAVAELTQVAEDLQQVIAARIAAGAPGDDILSTLCRSEFEGRPLTPEELLGEALLLVNGGVDTTTSVIGSILAWLSEHPSELARLRADPSLLPIATEEFLRVFAPVTAMARTCTRDYEIGGRTISAGEPVLMSFVGANRDPKVFEDPDAVKLDRWPNRHASFGLGIHRCIGSNLARAEIHIVLEEMLQRMQDIHVDVEHGTKYPDFGVNQGWVDLQMTFTPGPKLGSELQL